MNTGSCIGISTMKPCCRIWIGYRISSIFGGSHVKSSNSGKNNLLKSHSKLVHHCCYSNVKCQEMGYCKSMAGTGRRAFCVSDSSWGQSAVLAKNSFRIDKGSRKRGVLVIPCVGSDIRNHSTLIESHVNEKGFEKIYIQGGLNVKPLVIEKIETSYENVVKEEENRVEVNGATVDLGILKDSNEKVTAEREASEIEKEAWKLLRDSVVSYCGNPVGTVAANDPADKQPLNYDQVFIRDFVPSAFAFLLNGEHVIVKNFLLHTLQLQSWEKTVDCYSPGQGLMPASFKVRTVPLDGSDGAFEEILDPDFGESAIGRVAPVDSGLWWIILLRAYGKITDGFDMFPSLLVTDGSCMIDRRMGIHGHPLEIQALFYAALRCSREMLIVNDGTKDLVAAINNRLSALSFHICYPALEYEDWRIITGGDPKNTPWSYHNGGSWPTLLWQFTLACIKMGRPELAQKAVALAEQRLSVDKWPEYYDTRSGRFIGKQSRLNQTWTIAGFLASKMLLENPEKASLLFWEEDYELLEICVCALSKTGRKKCSLSAARSQNHV
ncbi:hypothetical protein QYF36_020807 [Acer negundo]|nr:hypothetical protein QYF36_020807 [Acer negundo]